MATVSDSASKPAPLYIGGPTGAGKSAVALALAERCGGEIINADAFQLYRGMEVLSASPTAADRARAPHHLYGALAPTEDCNAGRYAELARPLIAGVAARGELPIVVGGSGLYLKSLTHGLADLPPADAELRSELGSLDLGELVAMLRELDPAGAESVPLQNRRYVTRAVEICLLTGRPGSELRRWPDPPEDLRAALITRPREQLYARIDARAEAMLEAGLVEEVAALPADLSATAAKAIGIREARALLAGEIDRADCIAAIARNSRRYAKRQLTWFRREREFQSVCLAVDEPPESAATRIAETLDLPSP